MKHSLTYVVLLLIIALVSSQPVAASNSFDDLAQDVQNATELAEMAFEIQSLLLDIFELMEMELDTFGSPGFSDRSEAPIVPDGPEIDSAPPPVTPPVPAKPEDSSANSGGSNEDSFGSQRSYQAGPASWAMRLAPAAEFPHGSFDHPHMSYAAFWIAETEVTYSLWFEIYQWAHSNGYSFSPAREGSSATTENTFPGSNRTHPAVRITWIDALIWCNALSEYMDLQPVYHYSGGIMRDASAFYAADETVMSVDVEGFRLPTEMEWHLAARYAGTQSEPGLLSMGGYYWTPRNWASGATADITNADAVHAVAWIDSNSSSTQPVGQLRPNALGLYDMTGNASEWIFHQYGHIASTRGGSYYHDLRMVGAGDQSHNFPYYNAYTWVGFRLARSDFSLW